MTAQKSLVSSLVIFPLAIGLMTPSVHAVDVVKGSSGTTLNVGSAWALGNVPTSSDVAVWDSTSNGGSQSAGGTLDFQGIRIGSLASNLTMTVGSGNTLTLGASGIDMSAAGADLAFGTSGTLALGAAQTWSIGSGRTLSRDKDMAITGSGLTISGPGTFLLADTGTHAFGTGSLTLGGGLVVTRGVSTGNPAISNSVSLGGNIAVQNPVFASGVRYISFSGGVDVSSGVRNVTISSTDSSYDPHVTDGRYASVVSWGAISGAGTMTLTNGNTGANAGKAVATYLDGTISVAALSFGNGVEAQFSGSNRLTNSTALTVDGVLGMSRGGASASTSYSQTVKSLAGSGTVTNFGLTGTVTTSTLTIDGGVTTGTTTFSGVIEDNDTRRVALTKDGANTQILSGANTYTGDTTVNAGTLLINGSLGNTAVTVDGGVLGGTGTIAGATAINSTGTLSPGASPGTLTFDGDLTLNNGSTYRFEGGDLVDVNGTLDLNSTWTLALQTGFQDGGSVVLFTYSTLAGSPDLTPTIDTTNLGFTPSGPLTLSDSGSSIILHGISVVPEPSAIALLGLAGLAGCLLRRRAVR